VTVHLQELRLAYCERAITSIRGVKSGGVGVKTPDRDAEERLRANWRLEQSVPVAGWEFSHLQERMDEDEPTWNFDALCRHALERADHVLDMGTGGGEQLPLLADVLPTDTVATEGWPPNVPVARTALAAHGISVTAYDAESSESSGTRMPFEDDRFDLVLNRHQAFVAEEVARVLAPGAEFLNQQASGGDAQELHDLFGAEAFYPAHLKDTLLGQIHRCGLEVQEEAEWSGAHRFRDVSALVAYLHLVPWYAPEEFTVDR